MKYDDKIKVINKLLGNLRCEIFGNEEEVKGLEDRCIDLRIKEKEEYFRNKYQWRDEEIKRCQLCFDLIDKENKK